MRHWGKEFGCCHAGELQLSIKAWRQRLSNRMSWNTGQVISRQLPFWYLLGKEAINSLDAFNLNRNFVGERKSSNLRNMDYYHRECNTSQVERKKMKKNAEKRTEGKKTFQPDLL